MLSDQKQHAQLMAPQNITKPKMHKNMDTLDNVICSTDILISLHGIQSGINKRQEDRSFNPNEYVFLTAKAIIAKSMHELTSSHVHGQRIDACPCICMSKAGMS